MYNYYSSVSLFRAGIGDCQRGNRLSNVEACSLGLRTEWPVRARETWRTQEFVLKLRTAQAGHDE